MSHRQFVLVLTLLVFSTSLSPMIIVGESLQDTTIDITIAYTHDLHSHLYSSWTGTECSGGMTLLSTKIQELRALRPTLLFDCGDIISGGGVNDINNGLPMVEVMNTIGYDAMALDNHEFDPGTPALKAMINAADFELLSANVDWPGNPKPLPYSIETIAGYDIGVIGLSTSFWYAPDEVTFADQVTSVNNAVTDLQGQGIDFIILLGCLSTSIASSVTGIDLLVKAGGSVQTIGNTLVVPSVGSYANGLGILDLTIDTTTGTIDSYDFSAPSLGAPLDPDETIVSMIDIWNAPLSSYLDEAFGYFDSYQSTGSLGVMMAEAILRFTEADVGTYNSGGVREAINRGFITYRDLHHTEPFFNYVATVDLKGSDVTSVIGSNYYYTEITSFDPDTWYTVASSNFSVTFFERTYTSGAVNRQDYPSETVVDTFASYLTNEYTIMRSDLLSVIDDCMSSVSSLPNSYMFGGTASTLRDMISNQLGYARNAMETNDDLDTIDHLSTAIDLIDVHVSVSCPVRWLNTNLENIIDILDVSISSTFSSPPTSITSPTTTETSIHPPPDAHPLSPWSLVVVVELLILATVIVYYFGLIDKLRSRS
ncbi:MAG: bifunctional metallophosphatase/5'-nucleotidase [Candidatus Thorarchaeota archaeon]